MSANPFTASVSLMRANGLDSRPPDPHFAGFGIFYAAEGLWDLLNELPNKGEATLAQRRLEEAVFWGCRAYKPDLAG
ncbi:hypothetical protein V5G24_00205 [Xanthobacter sp. VTT E-85241]|uniref:Acb2/Tad1 domain-containing protein n=1 Tax=Roseixanthobacter finlandensis TaxID=3119922 RepID=UPI00372CD451